MASYNLGNIVGMIRSLTAPLKKYIIWAKQIDTGDLEKVVLMYYDKITDSWNQFNASKTFYLPPVISTNQNTPAVSPTLGDTYLLGASPTGAWVGKAFNHATWMGNTWVFISPQKGTMSRDVNSGSVIYYFDGTDWFAIDTVLDLGPGSAGQMIQYQSGSWVKTAGLTSTDGDLAIDLSARRLKNGSATVIDWTTRQAYNSSGGATVNWQTGRLSGGTSLELFTKVDWANGFLMYVDGDENPVRFNWTTGQMYNSGSFLSADFENHLLYDNEGSLVANYSLTELIGGDGVTPSMNWRGQQLFGQWTSSGKIIFANNQGIDVAVTGGTDILNIGTSNADVINIGYSGSVVNIQGTLAYQNVTNWTVKDKLITLNKGGSASSAVSTGFEIEEDAIITGWFTTDGSRSGWEFKAPGVTNKLIFDLSLLASSDKTIQIPNRSGIFATTNDLNFTLSTASNVVDINGKGLVFSDGGNVRWHVADNILYDNVSQESADFVNRTLKNSAGAVTVNWSTAANGLVLNNIGASGGFVRLKNTNVSGTINLEFPVASGTFALTSDISTLAVLRDGTTQLTSDWNIGNFNLGIGGTPLACLYANSTGVNTSQTAYYTAEPQGETSYIEAQPVIANSSTGTGTDFTPSNTVFAIKITTPSGTQAHQGISVRIKKTGVLTDESYIQFSLYADNAGAPGVLQSVRGSIYGSQVTASYTEISTLFQGSAVGSSVYWLVVTRSESGGAFVFDAQVGTGTTYQGATIPTATTESNVNIWFKLFSRNNYAIHAIGNHSHAIVANSLSGVGVLGVSVGHYGGYFSSVSDHGLVGVSTYGSAVRGVSTTNYGGNFTSTSGFGVAGVSTSNDGGYFISTSRNGVNGQTASTSWSAGYFNNTAGRLALFTIGQTWLTGTALAITNTFFKADQPNHTGGVASGLLWTAGTLTGQTASSEIIDQHWNNAATLTRAAGTVALQRGSIITGRTYAFVSASTITITSALDVVQSLAGTNATLSTNFAQRWVYDASNYAGFSVTSAGNVIFSNTGSTFNISKTLIVGGDLQNGSTASTSQFYSTFSTATTTSTTQSELLFSGATTVFGRVFERGTANFLPTANTSYASHIVGTQAVTIAGSGTHGLFAGTVFNPISITAGAGTVTGSATVYINGAATGATNNYAFWVASGQSRFDGSLTLSNVNMILGTSTGSKLGTSVSQLLGIWNATPIVQPSGANQAALTDSTTGTASFTLVDVGLAFSQANINNNFASMARLLNEIRTNVLVAVGLMKGSV